MSIQDWIRGCIVSRETERKVNDVLDKVSKITDTAEEAAHNANELTSDLKNLVKNNKQVVATAVMSLVAAGFLAGLLSSRQKGSLK